MAVLTEEMKALVKSGRCFVATAGKDGRPNIGPKGSVIVVDDSTLAFGELTGKQSLRNLRENPRVAVAVVDYEKYNGYRFQGTAVLESSGGLYDKFARRFAEMKMPKPEVAVKIKVEEIYSLAAKNPGEKIS